MKTVKASNLVVGDKFKMTECTQYVHEVRQILTDQTSEHKQLLCLTDNDSEYTYYTLHYKTDYDVYLVNHAPRLNELKVGDKFRWFEDDTILKIVTEKLDDHIVYMYTTFGTTYYSVHCEAEPTWNNEVILEDEETN